MAAAGLSPATRTPRIIPDYHFICFGRFRELEMDGTALFSLFLIAYHGALGRAGWLVVRGGGGGGVKSTGLIFSFARLFHVFLFRGVIVFLPPGRLV